MPGGFGQTEADGPRTAVEVKHLRFGAGRNRPFTDLTVDGLRLQGVHLQEGLRLNLEVNAAEALTHSLTPPEGIELAGKHRIEARFVDVQHDAGEEGAGAAQEADKVLRPAAEAPGGRDAEHGVPVRLAPEKMADRPPAALFAVSGDSLAVHKVNHRLCRLQAAFALQQAVGDRDDVVAAGAVKAEDGFPVPVPDGKNGLVAAAVGIRAGVDAVGPPRLPAEAAQAVVHMLLFDRELGRIAKAAQTAAAAGVRAGIRDPVGRGFQHPGAFCPDGGVGHLEDQDFPVLARKGPGDKNSPPVETADAVTLDGTGLDRDRVFLIFT